ncbi:hypothetical protein HDU96_002889 [Phlyctochytrium bullatum]|nr:hypothetical protein HDU96_002889 [Phlyctochytrium bullatum]
MHITILLALLALTASPVLVLAQTLSPHPSCDWAKVCEGASLKSVACEPKGSDGITYLTECELKMQACLGNTSVSVKMMGPCGTAIETGTGMPTVSAVVTDMTTKTVDPSLPTTSFTPTTSTTVTMKTTSLTTSTTTTTGTSNTSSTTTTDTTTTTSTLTTGTTTSTTSTLTTECSSTTTTSESTSAASTTTTVPGNLIKSSAARHGVAGVMVAGFVGIVVAMGL